MTAFSYKNWAHKHRPNGAADLSHEQARVYYDIVHFWADYNRAPINTELAVICQITEIAASNRVNQLRVKRWLENNVWLRPELNLPTSQREAA